MGDEEISDIEKNRIDLIKMIQKLKLLDEKSLMKIEAGEKCLYIRQQFEKNK